MAYVDLEDIKWGKVRSFLSYIFPAGLGLIIVILAVAFYIFYPRQDEIREDKAKEDIKIQTQEAQEEEKIDLTKEKILESISAPQAGTSAYTEEEKGQILENLSVPKDGRDTDVPAGVSDLSDKEKEKILQRLFE